jgi:Global regulator protein family
MALILGVKRGSKFYRNDVPVEILDTKGYEWIKVQVEGRQFIATPHQSVEIYPGVMVSSGVPKVPKLDMLPRLVIDAPRDIVILREELYERSKRRRA